MPSYDPRELSLRLNISRKYNLELIKQNEKLKIEFNDLLEKYHELVKFYVMEQPGALDGVDDKFTKTD